ncbi:hypothetical protein [uncultured Mediterranean phage uvMED]|nr:hypothetical protein [uncultured Mediterranean phage uvMED]
MLVVLKLDGKKFRVYLSHYEDMNALIDYLCGKTRLNKKSISKILKDQGVNASTFSRKPAKKRQGNKEEVAKNIDNANKEG